MQFWLVKSEPSVCSITHLEREGSTVWDGVRNYQARNMLRIMRVGDPVLFYHSSEEPVGVAGRASVVKEAFPDPTQFDPKSRYFDPKSSMENPRWWCPKLSFVSKFHRVVPLSELRSSEALKQMTLLRKGSRLSVHQLTEQEFMTIQQMGES